MEILIRGKVTTPEIKLGDIFVDTDTGDIYMLMNRGSVGNYPIALISINDPCDENQMYDAYDSIVTAKEYVYKKIKEEELVHYSQDEWHLELKRK